MEKMQTDKTGRVMAALAMALALGTAGAQGNDELVSLGKKTGVGARAIAMGEAFTAVADDYSALYYNPAGMTQLTRSEVGVNLGYGMFRNDASFADGAPRVASLEAIKLNALALILTDGDRWALGLGYYSPVSFEDPLSYQARGSTYAYNASGEMDHYRLALGYRVNDAVRLGFAVSAISGREQLEIEDGITARYLEEYVGYNLEPSFLIRLSDQFRVGGSAVVVEGLQLTDTYQEQGYDAVQSVYEIHHPFQAKLGLAFQSGLTQISADWHGDFWSSYAYRGEDAAFFTRAMNYPNKHTFNLGLEQGLDRSGTALRLGYTWESRDDDRLRADERNPYRFSAGIGFLPARQVNLDFAYRYGGSRSVQNSLPEGPDDLAIEGQDHQVMAALRYRW
ncbi:MAG: outer membrane protein transport protein [Fibrobacteria bacterium]